MPEYPNRLESVDIERHMEAKNRIVCISCSESVPEDGNWHFIVSETWCHQCVIDADIVGHTYG